MAQAETVGTVGAARYTPRQIEAARGALAALALVRDGDDLYECIALAVARLTVEQVGGPGLAYPALLWLVDRDLFAVVMGRTGGEARAVAASRVAVAAGALVELCVLATWSDGSPRKLPEVVSDLTDAIWAIVDQGEVARAGELLEILLDSGLIAATTAETRPHEWNNNGNARTCNRCSWRFDNGYIFDGDGNDVSREPCLATATEGAA